jgi:hypothetical protein
MGRSVCDAVRRLAEAGLVEFDVHAHERFEEFDIAEEDIMSALENAVHARSQHRGRVLVQGPDLLGYELHVVAEVSSRIYVVTAMWPKEE